jgi:hypothetical protein
MGDRGSTSGIPVWARVSGIIVLVLVGVVISATLVGAVVGGDAGTNQHGPAQRQDQNGQSPGDNGGGGHRPPAGGH